MDQILKTHYVDPSYLRSDDYAGFIESRRRLLITEIAKVMGKPVIDTGEAVAEDETDEAE